MLTPIRACVNDSDAAYLTGRVAAS